LSVNSAVTVASASLLIWIFCSYALMKKTEKIRNWLYTKRDNYNIVNPAERLDYKKYFIKGDCFLRKTIKVAEIVA